MAPPTTEILTSVHVLSRHDALPISRRGVAAGRRVWRLRGPRAWQADRRRPRRPDRRVLPGGFPRRPGPRQGRRPWRRRRRGPASRPPPAPARAATAPGTAARGGRSADEIGRANARNPVNNAHLVITPMLE